MSLGKRLREARMRKGLTQEEAAKHLDITFQALSNYERDIRDPDTNLLKKIADLYGVTTDYLLGRTEHKQGHISDAKVKTEIIAAHRSDDPMSELPEEARKSLEEFKEFILRKYGKGRE